MLRVIVSLVVTFFLYFLLWPLEVEPLSWSAPQAPEYEGDYELNSLLAKFDVLRLPKGQSGPEGVLSKPDGSVYATTEQGWVVRWMPGSLDGEAWVKLPGRGLGICKGKGDDFWVADAFEGIFHIDAEGQIQKVLDTVAGQPLLYSNDLVLAPNGKLYISDSTTRFSAKAYGSTYAASLADILEHGRTGRVIEFDPVSGKATVIMDGLSFANGVTADPAGEFILVNETSEYRVWKYWLRGERIGQAEVIVDNLPGFPDNILAGDDGRFWLGFTSPRLTIIDKLADKPFIRKIVQRLPKFVRPAAKYYGHVLAISEYGEILQNLQDPHAAYPLTTGVSESENYLYLSSLVAPVLARITKADVGL